MFDDKKQDHPYKGALYLKIKRSLKTRSKIIHTKALSFKNEKKYKDKKQGYKEKFLFLQATGRSLKDTSKIEQEKGECIKERSIRGEIQGNVEPTLNGGIWFCKLYLFKDLPGFENLEGLW